MIKVFEVNDKDTRKNSRSLYLPLGTGRKLNAHKTFRRRPECLLTVLYTLNLRPARSSRPEVFCKKVLLEISQKSQENTYARVTFLKSLFYRPEACNFIKKQTLEQVFSCEFCEISKNTFFHGTPLVAASVLHPGVYLWTH